MTGKTHVVGGNVFALGSYILMKKTGLLVDSVWEPLQLGIILPYATWASTLPDLDQNNKNRIETNPINSVIRISFIPERYTAVGFCFCSCGINSK